MENRISVERIKKTTSHQNQTNQFSGDAVATFAECTPYYKEFENVHDWINTLPEILPSSKSNENSKIKIISNILIQEQSPINQNTLESESAEKPNNCFSDRKSSSTGSIIPSTIYSKGTKSDKLSSVDDSLKDPHYKPTSDEEKEGVECAGKLNFKDRRDFCMFCEKDVSHFARHVSTWHSSEIEIARILSIKDPKETRIMYSNLRKRGNFIHNRTNTKLRPVKRLNPRIVTSTADDFLPCKYCLGFYKKKTLYRHTKKCSQNAELNSQKRQTSQSDGQTALLLRTLLKYDQLLTAELFPCMRADEISLIAKKDPLICQYAYSYIKGRKSKGNLDLVRQNVRLLAKLLKITQNQDGNIKQLIDILNPCCFKMIIDGVNEIAQFNHKTERYESPTLAVNFGTLLKKCCDLAFVELLQKPNTEKQREDLNLSNWHKST
ncbi:hypothetical protein MML48_9g00004125 [Holotrichia oblita]|uniref:Uncharacterized protein n=1 Tax=Holotrichia oblita TaxID=644536 RepID=A0ACB9SKV0_HOLOL|nr:hypothetical protein MML48_9g00004125 [Holotrichia oblita]